MTEHSSPENHLHELIRIDKLLVEYVLQHLFKPTVEALLDKKELCDHDSMLSFCAAADDTAQLEVRSIRLADENNLEIWKDICRELKEQGIESVERVVVDMSPGLVDVVREVFPLATVKFFGEENLFEAEPPQLDPDDIQVIVEFDEAGENTMNDKTLDGLPEDLLDSWQEKWKEYMPPFSTSHSLFAVALFLFLISVIGVSYPFGEGNQLLAAYQPAKNTVDQSLTAARLSEMSNDELKSVLNASGSNRETLRRAVRESAKRGNVELMRLVAGLSSHPHYLVRIEVVKALGSPYQQKVDENFMTLVRLLEDEEYLVRGYAAKALGTMGDDLALIPLMKRLAVEEDEVVQKILQRSFAKLENGSAYRTVKVE